MIEIKELECLKVGEGEILIVKLPPSMDGEARHVNELLNRIMPNRFVVATSKIEFVKVKLQEYLFDQMVDDALRK